MVYIDEDNVTQQAFDNVTFKSKELIIVGENIWRYGAPILMAIGTFGNVCSVIVLSRKRMRKITMNLFLLALAIVDISMLWTGLLRKWIDVLLDVDFRILSGTSCKFHIFIQYTLRYLSSWIVMMVSIERFIAVFFPLRVKLVCKRLTFLIALSTVVVALVGLNLHFFWTFDLVEKDGTLKCETKADYVSYRRLWSWVNAMFASVIPSFVMFISSSLIIGKLVLRRCNTTTVTNGASKLASTISILILCNLFLLLILPSVIYQIRRPMVYPPPRVFSDYMLMGVIFNFLHYMNNVTNFFIYCVASKRFRRELVSIFKA
ncbi:unnamed protein product [Owenia fusiformis]|uniref:Uncharacterized protein n=1 Tax=Owenia fusiformis TaxID=6347 RepID=A0A8J1UCJ8_OWEFU|nr:unnamed protein product [Owenia fusiformis]